MIHLDFWHFYIIFIDFFGGFRRFGVGFNARIRTYFLPSPRAHRRILFILSLGAHIPARNGWCQASSHPLRPHPPRPAPHLFTQIFQHFLRSLNPKHFFLLMIDILDLFIELHNLAIQLLDHLLQLPQTLLLKLTLSSAPRDHLGVVCSSYLTSHLDRWIFHHQFLF